MIEKTYETPCGAIHYWIGKEADNLDASSCVLPGGLL